jgi:probable F420-dependent oxidoreductase
MITDSNEVTLSLGLVNFSPESPGDWSTLLRRAKMAEEAGIDRVIVVDHVVMGPDVDEYDGGTFPTGPGGAWLEPVTVLSVIAGMTSRIRLTTSILIAPLRRPVVLAKSLATLDVLSGGRLDIGVGVGWQSAEYRAAGLDYRSRGRLLDECLAVCRVLWGESPATFHSDTLSFDSIWCEPKPVQRGGVPLWLGGTLNPRNVERIVTYGSGWIPWGDHRHDLPGAAAQLRRELEAGGRDPYSVVVQGTIPIAAKSGGKLDLALMLEDVPGLVRAGITDFVVRTPPDPDEKAELESTQELTSRFRDVAR